MIDIHCHILPRIDDGPSDMETSIEMLKMASEDGITHTVATPHFTYGERPTARDIYDRVIELKEGIMSKGIPVKVLAGADIRLTYELLYAIEKSDIPTINGSRYFLLELPDLIPPNLDNLLFTAELNGLVPVITHPERNYSFLSSPGKAKSLREAGALLQLTAMSITGDFGPQIQRFSHMLLKKGLVDFIATDAHNTSRRIPVLSKAYREVAGLCDKDEADRIFFENPLSVIENKGIKLR
ncbi:MAG: CpsB/CapC family capsule biosynthesis tyrosine phosphatase [Nitrospirota bacterium]